MMQWEWMLMWEPGCLVQMKRQTPGMYNRIVDIQQEIKRAGYGSSSYYLQGENPDLIGQQTKQLYGEFPQNVSCWLVRFFRYSLVADFWPKDVKNKRSSAIEWTVSCNLLLRFLSDLGLNRTA
jgi:hypothetical protein